ncbi:MAG TPA: hypothetical protein ENG00_00045 [Candidatus Aenigmarchaeota archaeon]|nr:hypothetical protein [Candidatus Aenigmarchaeota archaeon]
MVFQILPVKNKELFLRYAVPCGEVLVKRGELRRELLQKLHDSVMHRQDINLPVERFFPVASRMCTVLAIKMGKKTIDDEVIRRYFLIEHEKAIIWRRQVKPDIDIRDCRVYPGRVIEVYSGKALVKTPMGEVMLRTDFVENLKPGDWITKHYDYAIEKIKTSYLNRMLRR